VADYTTERIERNNEVFREANERIRIAAAKYDHELERIPFLCECAVEDCSAVVRLTEDEYSAVRVNPRHYFTAPGHEEAERPVGHAVSRTDGYVVVEKG
jgi:hypothetical protein